MYYFSRPAIIKYHSLSGLNNRNLCSCSSRSKKSTIQVLAGLVFSEPLSSGFPGGIVLKNLPVNARGARNMGLIPWLGRFPGVGNGNPFQYSCLENSLEREA